MIRFAGDLLLMCIYLLTESSIDLPLPNNSPQQSLLSINFRYGNGTVSPIE